jgi:hypothetical protein
MDIVSGLRIKHRTVIDPLLIIETSSYKRHFFIYLFTYAVI